MWKKTILAVLALSAACHAQNRLTARQVIELIQQHAGGPWSGPTVDTFKAGDPDTPVTGIVTTFAATYDVLERVVAEGANLIVAHEPTFYNHQDSTDGLKSDPVYQAKLRFIEQHHLVVWRFHDHWHHPTMKPDGIMLGMIHALAWEKNQDPANEMLFTFPETTLESFALSIRDRLQIRDMRVVGDPTMKVRRIAFLPGAAGVERQIQALEIEGVDVLVAGEAREWETVEYARDALAEKRHKALILLGHVPSEEEGMRNCALWLKTFLPPRMPVTFLPAGEPFARLKR